MRLAARAPAPGDVEEPSTFIKNARETLKSRGRVHERIAEKVRG